MQNTKQVLDWDNKDIFKRKREFYLDEDLVDKIDSIEYGAQVNKIEEIEVNWVPVEPDESKTVKLKIPRVINAVTSDSESDALSAAMGKYLYTLITEWWGWGWGWSYIAWNWINISWNVISNTLPWAVVSATAPSNPTKWMIWYDTTNDELKTYDWSQWNVTGKEYNAWPWIEIWTVQDYSAMRWPCPEGFHIPSASEWQNVIDSCDTILNDIWDIWDYLKMSFDWGRDWTDWSRWSKLAYWACTCTEYNGDVFSMNEDVMVSGAYFANGLHIRPFSDTIHIPDNTRTTIYDASSVATWAWIFHNPTLWLISISDDWENWITIADKNVWATTVWNNWDTSTQENSWWFFQWWNNYMFSFSWNVTTSSTQVDATWYWPGNYYSSDTFIIWSYDWSSVRNDNLRWWDTWVVTIENAISNTWVLSVNGQTWHVEIAEGNTKTFFLKNSNDLETAQAAVDRLATWGNSIIQYGDESYIISYNTVWEDELN